MSQRLVVEGAREYISTFIKREWITATDHSGTPIQPVDSTRYDLFFTVVDLVFKVDVIFGSGYRGRVGEVRSGNRGVSRKERRKFEKIGSKVKVDGTSRHGICREIERRCHSVIMERRYFLSILV